jgi:hypothetical protein
LHFISRLNGWVRLTVLRDLPRLLKRSIVIVRKDMTVIEMSAAIQLVMRLLFALL